MLNGFNIGYPRDKQFCQYNQGIHKQVLINNFFVFAFGELSKPSSLTLSIATSFWTLSLLLLQREISMRFQHHHPPKINLGKLHYNQRLCRSCMPLAQ